MSKKMKITTSMDSKMN